MVRVKGYERELIDIYGCTKQRACIGYKLGRSGCPIRLELVGGSTWLIHFLLCPAICLTLEDKGASFKHASVVRNNCTEPLPVTFNKTYLCQPGLPTHSVTFELPRKGFFRTQECFITCWCFDGTLLTNKLIYAPSCYSIK